MWDRITPFYSGLYIPSTKPCRQPLRSLELFKNPHKAHKLRASVFPLMSLRLTCMSWMRHISITLLMCQMSYFIIKYVCSGCAVLSKIKKIFCFCCSFHPIHTMYALPNFTSVLHFIYHYKRGKKVESKLWVQFWVESKLLLSSWFFFLISLHPVCFWMPGLFPTWLEVKGNCFCPMGPERLVWNEPMICLPRITETQRSFMATLTGCAVSVKGLSEWQCYLLSLKDILSSSL